MSWGEGGIKVSEHDQGVIACTLSTEPAARKRVWTRMGHGHCGPGLSDGAYDLRSFLLLIL